MEVVLEIIKAGMLTSIQDLGRNGLNNYAIAISGAMDPYSAKIANLLLRKEENAAVIECTLIGPSILFHHSAEIAIAGGDFSWKINGEEVATNQVLKVVKGDLLSGAKARDHMRAYIAINGKLAVEAVMASKSTQINAGLGGFQGRPLKKGDLLTWTDAKESREGLIRIYEGPEFDYLDEKSKKALYSIEYRISSDTNRMGLRLEGETLLLSKSTLSTSRPLLPGFIQVPPSGLPIIVLQDGQTTGGYPRIAYLKKEDLGRLNQIRIGENVRFIKGKSK